MDTIKFVLSFLILIRYQITNAEIKEFELGNKSILQYKLDTHNISSQVLKTQDGFYKLDLPGVNFQQIDGLPELPMINILLLTDKSNNGEDIEVEMSNEILQVNGRLNYFKGQKCRCRNIEDAKFDSSEYFSKGNEFFLESFGDYRGKKVLRLNVMLGFQGNESFELYKNVMIKIPKDYQQLKDFNTVEKSSDLSTLIIAQNSYRDLILEYQRKIETNGRKVFFEEMYLQ